MKKKFITILILFFNLFCTSVYSTNFDIKANTAILQDYLSGEILFEKNADDKIYPASMTKIMTAIVAFDLLKKGETSLDELTKEIEEEIVKIQENLISTNDYEKLQNKFENQFVNSNSSVSGIGSSLAEYYTLYGDANLINSEIEIYRSITREEIKDIAQKYLKTNQRLILEYLPENQKK